MMGVFLLHIINDGFTVTSSGVAIAQAASAERQAGAQGLLGGLQTLTGGIAATFAGWSYEHLGRGTTFSITAIVMVLLVIFGLALAGSEHRSAPVAVPTSLSWVYVTVTAGYFAIVAIAIGDFMAQPDY